MHTSKFRVLVLAIILGLAVAACGGVGSTGELQGVVFETPQPKPEFTHTNTQGNAFDFAAETEGKLTLLYFGYLNCPDVCPVHLAQIAESFDRVPDVARDAMVVFVSVDPERDSPEEVREYLDRFDERFIGLTGTLEELEAAQVATGLPVAIFVGEGDDYTVNHAAQVISYSPDGLSYAIYPFGVRQSQWDNDLPILASIEG